jgi:hypothetical protein
MGPSQMANKGHTDSTESTDRGHHRWWGMESPKARNDTKFESKLYKKKHEKHSRSMCWALREQKHRLFKPKKQGVLWLNELFWKK